MSHVKLRHPIAHFNIQHKSTNRVPHVATICHPGCFVLPPHQFKNGRTTGNISAEVSNVIRFLRVKGGAEVEIIKSPIL